MLHWCYDWRCEVSRFMVLILLAVLAVLFKYYHKCQGYFGPLYYTGNKYWWFFSIFWHCQYHHHTTTTVLLPFFWDHPGELVPEENFWTLWSKGRLTEADTLTIRLGATPSGLTSAHRHHPPYFLWAGCPSCCPTNSVKALKATSAFGLRRRC